MKSIRNRHMAQSALGALIVGVLTACGGGGGDGSNTGGNPAPVLTTATGVAAIGAPIVGGNVELKCASGATASAATDANGVWTASLKATDYPCVTRIAGGQANSQALASPLHSVVSAPGIANITPLTDLIVGILSGQDPSTWYASVTNGTLSGAITSGALSTAQGKLKTTLATLPGKPALPDGFDPLTAKFSAEKGDIGDDVLESYGAALAAAGITQADAAAHAAAGEALTREAYAGTAFTTPSLTTFRVGAAKTLRGDYVLSIPDPNRGNLVTKGTIDADGNLIALAADGPFTGFVSKAGNRIGELCTTTAGEQLSQYVFVSEELVPVTDVTELQGKTYVEYENCDAGGSGTAVFNPDGSFVFTGNDNGGVPDAPDMNIAQAFTDQGREEGESVVRAKAFKYTAGGVTTYVYLMVATKKGTTVPAINGETDYVLIGVSQ
ncbi:hypothetical protein [Cupriavidus sp. SW-Y-13]|uniref:hypothetical protein n=1 Tax=Cupriavidus sp. SW-Y-13 TaxID=2653854 RepID=UPI001365463A|nr:hypothetical protein [Cupriavidus sp. SW-Y-13]MWL88592.1 hypothetical protein [Cupriavidus sp. SW-Y-13]